MHNYQLLYLIFVCLRQWELSGKICLFILENTNQRSRKQLHEYHPDGKNSCYSPLIKKYLSSMEIRVIREIRVLLNIEILVFFG